MAKDDFLYSQVAQEIAQGKIDAGIWTKALAHSEGTEERTKSFYIKFRVDQMRDQSISYEKKLKGNEKIICQYCGHYDTAQLTSRGDTAFCLMLFLLFIIPGVIYAALNSGYIYTCKKCKAVLSDDKFKAY